MVYYINKRTTVEVVYMTDQPGISISYPQRQDRGPTGKRQRKKAKQKSFIRELMAMALQLFVMLMAFLFIQTYFVSTALVSGESMEPTLSDGDYLLINKYSELERFDVVIFTPPDKPDVQYVKRIIGLPGDTIEYIDNQLYLNGKQVDEPYVDYHTTYDGVQFIENYSLDTLFNRDTVPDGHYFVIGDNRDNSRDSRSFGYVPYDSVIGSVGKRVNIDELFN